MQSPCSRWIAQPQRPVEPARRPRAGQRVAVSPV